MGGPSVKAIRPISEFPKSYKLEEGTGPSDDAPTEKTSDPVHSGDQPELLSCASPKLRLAYIFNAFIKLLAARSADVARRLRRPQLRLQNPAVAYLSA